MKNSKEFIKNLQQANCYFDELGMDIRVGMTIDKIFFVMFDADKIDGYDEVKARWMNEEFKKK